MEVSHYFEFEETVSGGIKESVKHQRKALRLQGVDYTEKPDLSKDVLHLNVMGPRSIYYAWRARRNDVPVVVHSHVTAEDFGQSFRFTDLLAKPLKPYLGFAYSFADRIICPSEYNRSVMEDYNSTEKTVISNGVDTEKLEGFEELREEYLEKFDLEPPVVFNVGHVIKRKGLEKFVETAEEMPETDFIWFGPLMMGLKGRETKKLIKNSPENCQFPGFIEDIRGGFAAGDIFFFPTNEENEGIAMLEAMAAGKPMLLKDIETFQWLEDGKECLKADEDFAGELEVLMENPDIRKRLGEKAEEKSQEFTLEKVGEKLVSVYEELT